MKIFHMASMARSGETLLQRHMQAHSKIVVVHNLRKEDEQSELKLFNHLKQSPRLSIPRWSNRMKNYGTAQKSIVFLKQGVWEHKYPFRGFILARNPLSIFASLWTFDLKEKGGSPETNWIYNEERFVRWLGDIDAHLIPGFSALSPEHQFAVFYNRRMGALLETGLPIVYYENFVHDPAEQLRYICKLMKVQFEEGMLRAHSQYSDEHIGHGQIELARPIDTSSLDKYKKILSPRQIETIWDLTREVGESYGYKMDGEGMSLQKTERPTFPISQQTYSCSLSTHIAQYFRRLRS